MPRIGFVVVIAIAALTGCRNYDLPGGGPLALTPPAQARLDAYLAADHPVAFIVSEDGRYAGSLTCPTVQCLFGADITRMVRACEAESGVECAILAKGRHIVWRGQITRLKDGEIMTEVGVVALPDGDIRRAWCRLTFPGDARCLALEAEHHRACARLADDLAAYAACRTLALKAN